WGRRDLWSRECPGGWRQMTPEYLQFCNGVVDEQTVKAYRRKYMKGTVKVKLKHKMEQKQVKRENKLEQAPLGLGFMSSEGFLGIAKSQESSRQATRPDADSILTAALTPYD
ncbi:hypothetical protein B296_00059198, partial [Ensete ventricosum]